MGNIYCVKFKEFVKVGKTTNFKARLKALESDYEQASLEVWVSIPLEDFDSAESFAHHSLDEFRLGIETYNCEFETAVNSCISACNRSSSITTCGEVLGIPVKVDPGTGFINVTDFILAAKMDGKSLSPTQFLSGNAILSMKEQLHSSLGYRPYFSIRGRGASTYFHAFLFIEFCRSMSAKHKVSVYKWVLNEMVKCQKIKESIDKIKSSECYIDLKGVK